MYWMLCVCDACNFAVLILNKFCEMKSHKKKHAHTHAYILKALPSLIPTKIHWNGCIIETNTEWANIWWFVRLRHSAHPFHRHISNRVKPWTGCVIVWIFSDLCAYYIGNTCVHISVILIRYTSMDRSFTVFSKELPLISLINRFNFKWYCEKHFKVSPWEHW